MVRRSRWLDNSAFYLLRFEFRVLLAAMRSTGAMWGWNGTTFG
ncbi:hypothetical protein [Nostoc sp.]